MYHVPSACFGGCSSKVAFQKSSVVPAATIDVRVGKDKNGNYKVELAVENMAMPQDLSPSQKTYVVWVDSKQGPFNIGRLEIDKKLMGSLSATTPYEPEQILITAEDDAQVTKPGKQVALTSEKIK